MILVKEWIEEKIKNEYIRYFEYDRFSHFEEIGEGYFGEVKKAKLSGMGLVALKIIVNKNSKEKLKDVNDEFVKELKLLREIDYHPNINRILGITKDLLSFHIKNGAREDPIEGTPPKYQKLYQECWGDEPELRPDIEEVHEILSQLNTENSSDLQSSQPHIHNIVDKSNSKDTNDFYISDYPNPNSRGKFNILINNLLHVFTLNITELDYFNQLEEGKEKIKNLLIIGGTLSGKSVLSNILCDIGNGGTSNETKDLLKKDFEWNGTKYHVIEIVIWSIEKVIYDKITDLMPEGISQILFLVDESFTTREEIMFELFKKMIFETGILKYVTIIQNKCERDQKYVFENEIIAEIVKSCNDIIPVDNFPIDIDKEEDNNDYEGQIIIDRNAREEIRNKLLNYLEENFQGKYYKLEKWDDIYSKISNYTKSDMSFVEEVEKADITNMTSDIFKNLFSYIDSESKKRDQQWFNEKYSEVEVMDITDNRRLNFTDYLKIEGFKNLRKIRIKKFKLISLEIRNCSQLNEINLAELPILTSLSVTGCQKLTNLDCSSIGLTSLEISDCSQLEGIDLSKFPNLMNLSVTNCQKLPNFDCSSIKILANLTNNSDIELEHENRLTLSDKTWADLIALCQERGISIEGDKSTLIKALLDWKLNTRPVPAPSTPKLFSIDGSSGLKQDKISSLSLDNDASEIKYEDLEIGRKIGFKDCYAGKYKGQPVTIGELRVVNFSESDLKETKHEINDLKQIRHENIIQFIGISTNTKQLFIITEFCENGDLFDYMRKVPKPPFTQQIMFMHDIALGITYLHTRRPRIIHRDLKSMNILISSNLRAKINDFGLARIRPKANASMHTQYGTPNWQAPEFWTPNPSYTEKVDVYAAALIFWEILTWGEAGYPYHNYNEHQLYEAVRDRNVRPSLIELKKYPTTLLLLIQDMWDKLSSARPSMAQVVESLTQYLN
ncbi:unnamed protein product [Rhizophagus irregularis]|nr:unnamed protein product [Rhizophagus irregularis]